MQEKSSQAPAHLQVIALTMATKLACGGTTDHRGPLRRLSSEHEPSPTWTSCCCAKAELLCHRAACLGTEPEELQMLHTTLPARLGNDMPGLHCSHAPPPVTTIESLSAFLQQMHSAYSTIFLTSSSHTCLSK